MEGRVWIIDGEMYFSPNSSKDPGRPPNKDLPTTTFTPGASRADEFQAPCWWSETTEWMGFIPTLPIPYSGVWFESLAVIPRRLQYTETHGFALPGTICKKWLVVDKMLYDVVTYLGTKNHLIYTKPFPPHEWKYSSSHPTEEIANHCVKSGRDWFSMWIGLLYWMTSKTPEDDNFMEGLTPPRWFIQLIQYTRKIAVVDSIRTAPLLQASWNIARVGVWLRPLEDSIAHQQPPAHWFISQGVPIWYRWGVRERMNSQRLENAGFLKPSNEQIQAATTWISPSLGALNTALDYNWDLEGGEGPYLTQDSLLSSPIEARLSLDEQSPSRTRVIMSTNSGHAVWMPFLEKRKEAHERIRARESQRDRQQREDRERNPPTVSAPVYIWDWDGPDDSTRFTRTAVRVDEREETLQLFSFEQKRYDPYFNEWDCCCEWGADREDTPERAFGAEQVTAVNKTQTEKVTTSYPGDIPVQAEEETSAIIMDQTSDGPVGSNIVNSLRPFLHSVRNDAFYLERAQHEVLEILTKWFGFVSPVPIPAISKEFISEKEKAAMSSTLGLKDLQSSSPFFNTPLGKISTAFIRSFTERTEAEPNSDLWDLSPDNWKTLLLTHRISTIRLVRNANKEMYMFDFGHTATVPWKLAVYTSDVAMFVCRLDQNLQEEELALELVNAGVPFRTLQKRASLYNVSAVQPTSTIVPMRLSGHIFDQSDYEFYTKQCQSIFSLHRARAALLRGGFIWRIALQYISQTEAIRGPWGIHENPQHMFIMRDSNGDEYIDDELTEDELNTLCGLYKTFTGMY